ncbi:hypothetical protein K7X08_020457 [Anisodus acutangulus]|uniref:Josephin-like protein n=1 Tax=Anisodus acutangulus TaxID=402998 RepID=A0A9Q1M9H5_9SOLA|nr:hypothetical protein K7X08_020457 [Anisodus acutangulus]
MSARGRVKPEMTKNAKITSNLKKQNSRSVDGTTNAARSTTTCSFKMPNRSQLSPMKLFKHLGGKMAGVLKMVSPSSRRSCRKVTNSSERGAISKSSTTPNINIDSHRAEAIDDCIQFINSSSSLPRSNSVS